MERACSRPSGQHQPQTGGGDRSQTWDPSQLPELGGGGGDQETMIVVKGH